MDWMRWLVFALSLVPCLAPPARAAGNLENEAEDAGDVCDRFADLHPAGRNAQATDKDRGLFSSATPEVCLGYVYGSDRDLDKGRRCCLVLGKCNRELAVIFANGWGVGRSYDAAAWFLCHADHEMAPDEQAGMLAHLQRMRRARVPRDLDYCKQVTSGYGAAWCQRLRLDRLEPLWQRRG